MGDIETGPRKFVVFVDCLGDDDVEGITNFTRQHAYDGVMDAGNPYVTPKVMGEIYTGENPAVHGLPSVSRYGQDSRLRPAAPTLPEIAAESDEVGNVSNFGLPFIVPPIAQAEDDYWHISDAMGQRAHHPDGALPAMNVPGPVGDLADESEDSGVLLAHRFDNIQGTFGAARSLADAQDFDVTFISCRIADSYCHYRFREKGDDDGFSDREYVIREIDKQIEALTTYGDVFVFGDHGATDLEDVFRINRWMMEKGYLKVDIDLDFIRKSWEHGTLDEGEGPGEVIHTGLPGVEIDEANSVAVCDDPFSGGITLLDGADKDAVDDLIDDLESTPHVDHVDRTSDMWEGPLLHECPDLYPYRNVGTFISGNLAEEMGGPEVTRSGVHHPYGAFGATTDLDLPDTEYAQPTDIFRLILDDFLGIDPASVETAGRQYGAAPSEQDEAAVKERLQNLGYL